MLEIINPGAKLEENRNATVAAITNSISNFTLPDVSSTTKDENKPPKAVDLTESLDDFAEVPTVELEEILGEPMTNSVLGYFIIADLCKAVNGSLIIEHLIDLDRTRAPFDYLVYGIRKDY